MMPLQVQSIVEDLAERLSRATLLEDNQNRVLAYSEHVEPIDEVRHMSILRRHTSSEIISRLRAFGIYDAREPVRIPAWPPLGMLPRVCVPVRHADTLLGFLWFIDADNPMTVGEIDLAVEGAQRLGGELNHERFAAESSFRRETTAVRDLLAGDPVAAPRAARTVAEEAGLDPSAGVVALVVRPVLRNSTKPDDRVRAALSRALTASRRWLSPQPALHLVRDDHGVLLVLTGPECPGRPADDCAAKLSAEASAVCSRLETVLTTAVGAGGARTRLAAAVGTYEEAVRAARIAVLIPEMGGVAHWPRLGIYRMLAALPPDVLAQTSAHRGLERLFGDESKLPFLETMETYLDLAGNAHAAAERLHMHRATLYYRLQRVEELADASLKDGNDRLCLHLALKLGRLTGRYRPPHRKPAAPALEPPARVPSATS